ATSGSTAPAEGVQPQYTIDDLAALTGVPSRTIRFYQAKGALAPPVRRGRVAFYDDTHKERLRLVAHLQDRGLNLRAIRDLFARTDAGGVSLNEWLGVGEQLRVPWSDDRPTVLSDAQLMETLGAAYRPGIVAELLRTGLIRREPGAVGDSYFVPSRGMLDLALRLGAAGIDVDAGIHAQGILRKHLSRASDDLVDYFLSRLQDAEGPEGIMRSLDGLRAVAVDAVRLVFAQEVERALRTAMEEGRVVPPAKRRR
ncbi:MAG: MerR family transcriptional regulator, partial [Deltaproteobacteria bacterium]|nr:MerR family transcriptional regulator [Deltaproteobacteria bacterium]